MLGRAGGYSPVHYKAGVKMDYSKGANKKTRKELNSNKEKVKHNVGLIIVRIVIAVLLIVCFAVGGLAVGAYTGIIKNAPSVDIWVQPDIYTTVIMSAKTGQQVDKLTGDENRIYVQSDKIPDNLKNAFVAIEDERFYQHDGVDFQGMLRAAYTYFKSRGDTTQGASTITQQLIKNNVLKRGSNTIITKLQEQYMAVNFEKELTTAYNGDKMAAKAHILEVYLNTILLGHGYYGVQTAAKNYFNKDVSELTLSECAVIAAITQNPSKYSPDNHPDNNKQRATLVLDKMLELGMITQEQHDQAVNDDPYSRIVQNATQTDSVSSVHSYFVDAAISALSEELKTEKGLTAAEASDMIYNGGLQIYITQDPDMQKIMDSAMEDDANFPSALYNLDLQYYLTAANSVTGAVTNYSKEATIANSDDVQPQIDEWKASLLGPNDVIKSEQTFTIPEPQAAMVIMDYHTGQVKAMSGGRGVKTENRTFNRATDAERQPGSVFKILASYAPALDMGKINPYTIIWDEPYTYNGWSPQDWWTTGYKGPETVTQGIVQSMNILAAKNMVNTGIDSCMDYLQNFGFTTLVKDEVRNGQVLTDWGPATALGGLTDGVSVLETTAAYGAIANGGVYTQPIYYTKVLDHDGNVIIDHETPATHQVIKKDTAYMLTNMMEGVITDPNGTGRAAAFADSQIPIAGKTGTTTNTKDLYFVGYTPYYVAGIWGGYDTPKTMDKLSGSYHLPLWSKVMNAIHKDLPYKNFDTPDDLVTVSLCEDSGDLPTDLCYDDPRGDRIIQVQLPADAVPTAECDQHVSLTVDTRTGFKAAATCPLQFTHTYVGILVEDDYYDGSNYEIKRSVYEGSESIYNSSGYAPTPTPTPTPMQMFPPGQIYWPFATQTPQNVLPGQGQTQEPMPTYPNEQQPTVPPAATTEPAMPDRPW
jgi:penicillin-binding protein 1A